MRVRSTGLGKTEMVAHFEKLEPVDNGYTIMVMHSTEPVHWRIRVAVTGKDLRHLLGLALRPSVIFKVIGSMFKPESDKLPTTDY